jgi:preprotein translocase subunit SecD
LPPVKGLTSHHHNKIMKITSLLFGCLLAFGLMAAEPSKPSPFELRLVLDAAAADSEQLPLIQPGAAPGRTSEERIHVQKKPLLDRSALNSANVQKSAVTGSPEIQLTFTEQGARRFAEVTRQHTGKRLAIVIDGRIYSAPKVMDEVAGGKAVISGSFSWQEASQLAARLNDVAVRAP